MPGGVLMNETNTQYSGRPSLPMQGVPQPKRDEVLGLPRVHISTHPVMAHKMTALRDENTLQAMEYYNQLPHKVDLQVCYAVDPMLATGGSAIDAINILKLRGIPRLSYVGIIAAPYGLLKLSQTHPDIDIYVAALDESLNDRGYIMPGLGDAGDRQFGTF